MLYYDGAKGEGRKPDEPFSRSGVWHSLVVRLVRDQEAAGSSPVTPTKMEWERRCLSHSILFERSSPNRRLLAGLNQFGAKGFSVQNVTERRFARKTSRKMRRGRSEPASDAPCPHFALGCLRLFITTFYNFCNGDPMPESKKCKKCTKDV